MHFRFIAALATLLFVLAGCATPLERLQKETALPFAERWIGYLEDRDQESAWDAVSELAKRRYEKADRLKLWFGARHSMGDLVERDLELSWSVDDVFMRSVPDGAYWEVQFETEFEHQDRAIERLFLVWEDEQWRLLSYGIR